MLPLHNVTFFHNYCTIDSTRMSTAYPQHIHIVLFTTTLHSILALLFIYASFTQCDIFSQLLHNWLYNNVYSISATYTYSTVHNYTTQYTDYAVYICYPFHNVIFFHNDCTIHSTTMFTAYPQHIHTAQFTLHYPVNCHCYYICYTFHNMIFFHNYCTIDSTTMSTAYPQHIHTVLFTITLPSILTLLFIYASFTQCDIFSQLLHNWLDNNVYSISATYTYSIVYNYSPQYTGFAVYICFLYTMWHFFTMTAQLTLQQCLQHILNIYIRYCLQLHYPVYWLCCLYMLPLHNVTFFHNYCTSDSTTMSTAYP